MKTNIHFFLSYLAHFFLEWKMFQTKVVQKNHILCLITFFLNCAIYEVVWKDTGELGRQQRTMWCMHIACWILKATNTHSDYVILIAFLLQQWLHISTPLLCYMYITCLVIVCKHIEI